jgi:hypothetical protein
MSEGNEEDRGLVWQGWRRDLTREQVERAHRAKYGEDPQRVRDFGTWWGTWPIAGTCGWAARPPRGS